MSSAHTEALQKLLRFSGSAHEPQMKVALSRLAAETRERAKSGTSSAEYFVSVLRALSRIKGTAHAEIRLQCFKDCLVFFYTGGLSQEALDCADQMRKLAQSSSNRGSQRFADTLAGVIYGDVGNVTEAVLSYSRALSLAIALDDEEAQTSVLVNLGSSLNYAGLYKEAIPCFLRAIDIFGARTRTAAAANYLPPAYSNLAQSYLALGKSLHAYEAIRTALVLSEEPATAFDCYNRTVRELYFVHCALEAGDLDVAKSHVADCKAFALRCGTDRSKFISDLAAGLFEIKGGDVDYGLAMLERALASSVTDKGPYKAEALKTLVKAYDEVGRPEQALASLRALLSYIRSVREKGILALFSQSAYSLSSVVPTEFSDLQELTHKESELRAQVAERQLACTQIDMLERLAIAADLKEESSGQHGHRVGTLARLLGDELGLPKDLTYALGVASRLHDVGKIGVPDRILLSASILAEAERQFIFAHTLIGSELLAKSDTPQLKMAEEIARSHHEWWDGSGYPDRLAGKRIPLHARIVAIVDVYDAMTHGRPYAPACSPAEALSEISNRSGIQFDPSLVAIFIPMMERLCRAHEDVDSYLGRSAMDSPFFIARKRIGEMISKAGAYASKEAPNSEVIATGN
jgi:putative two-component system response regulator